MKLDDASFSFDSSCPNVLVLGGCSTGKSSIIGAVSYGCIKVPSTDATPASSYASHCLNAASSFLEVNPFATDFDSSKAQKLQEWVVQSDAVWVVVSALCTPSSAEMDVFGNIAKHASEIVLVLTHVDAICEQDVGEVKDVVRNLFRMHGIMIGDGQICIVNASGACVELVERYLAMCGKKRSIIIEKQPCQEQILEYEKYVKNGLLGLVLDRYRDTISYYCMPHDSESEAEFMKVCKPPFPITEEFKNNIRMVLQMPAPSLYLEHPDLWNLREKGYGLIQEIKFCAEYWRDWATDEAVAKKAKYVVDMFDQSGYEMGGAGNMPSVTDYVIDILEYAENQVKACKSQASGAEDRVGGLACGSYTGNTSIGGAISGFRLVEAILDHFGDEGVAKLLECADHQETEYLEFKTSYLLSEDERKKKVSQDALDWDIALAIIAIANTAGGALVIGIGKDNHTLFPVEVSGEKEAFLRTKIYHRLLPDQRVWKDGKGMTWLASELPRVEVRLYPYSDGHVSGGVVLMLIEPMPKGRYIRLEECANRERALLVQRKLGVGEVSKCYDTARFRTLDNERHIERGTYLATLRRLIPDANASPVGRSSGAYRFKPVDGGLVKDIEDSLVRKTEGHHLCCEFKPGDQIDKYIVEERIGSGGMGVVYRVRHVTLGREYALKAFKMESEDSSMAKERFRAEAQVLMQLNHSGLPKVHDLDFAESAECYYLVQDLIVGKDGKPHELGGYVVNPTVAAEQGLVCISGEIALKWLRQVCEIADYLHGKGIAHRDITLKNLLVTDNGDIKLTDFGVAKVMDPELRRVVDCQVTMTFTQTPNGSAGFLGTLRYLPPEVREKRKADVNPEATDVWAIGVSFFKVLTGEWFGSQQFTEYVWNDGIWGTLLRGMLKSDSHERLSCADVLTVLAKNDTKESALRLKKPTRYDKLVAAFREALKCNAEGVLPIIEMLSHSPLPNIESPTMGGQCWWDTLCAINGWKLQKNKFFNQIRILDPMNFRRAWGWRRGVERMLACSDLSSQKHGKLISWGLVAFLTSVLLAIGCYAIVALRK